MCIGIPALSLIVQALTLVALVYYACETFQIRKAAQNQAEAAHKPCVIVCDAARNPFNTVLSAGDIVSGRVALGTEGLVSLMNLGSGPALELHYAFSPINPPSGWNRPPSSSYLPVIPSKGSVATAFAVGLLINGYEGVFTYESLSGQRYESRITFMNNIITSFKFKPISD
jgi:hypothetical protein